MKSISQLKRECTVSPIKVAMELQRLQERVEDLKIALMSTVEFVQSHYPGVEFPEDLLEINRKALGKKKVKK